MLPLVYFDADHSGCCSSGWLTPRSGKVCEENGLSASYHQAGLLQSHAPLLQRRGLIAWIKSICFINPVALFTAHSSRPPVRPYSRRGIHTRFIIRCLVSDEATSCIMGASTKYHGRRHISQRGLLWPSQRNLSPGTSDLTPSLLLLPSFPTLATDLSSSK